MEPVIARQTWRTLEPLHAMIYFVAEAAAEYARVGVPPGRAGYFASRAAPMGAVSAETVIATFFNFNPDIISAVIPATWSSSPPADLTAARLRAADAALRRLLGDRLDGDDVVAAADLARRAAMVACEHLEGRPLFAGHVALEWPTVPHLVLWHAQTLLREYRGDGHIAALVADGVSGIEALVMHGAAGAIDPQVLQTTRGWPDDGWAAAAEGLRERGWLTGQGELTLEGARHRQWVEDRTDQLALAPYAALGESDCARLRGLVRPLSRAIIEGGGLPF